MNSQHPDPGEGGERSGGAALPEGQPDGAEPGRLEALVEQLRALVEGSRATIDLPGATTTEGARLAEAAALINQLAARARPAASSSPMGEVVLQDIIDHVPHSIFWKDYQGRFLGGNRHLLRDLGLARVDQLLGRTDHELGFPTAQADFFRECDLTVMDSGRALLEIEEPQDQADGTHTLLTSKVPLRGADGGVAGMLGIYVDITERKRMEQALRQARDAAEAASRAKGDFLTVVSHELRTPLTLILGPLDGLLGRPGLPPEVVADLERMRRNAGRLLVLVNDLLAVSALEAGRMEVTWERCDVEELVAQLLGDARPAARRAGLRLDLSLEGALGPLPVDRDKLEKILLNLVGNALKFTPAGGRVRVAVRAVDAATWELAVEDSGPGIPRAQQALLFRRFSQLEAGSRRRHEGSGLGLALVKELAERMGGTVAVESEEGAGARFRVRLPRHVEAARFVPVAEPAPRSLATEAQVRMLTAEVPPGAEAAAGAPPEADLGARGEAAARAPADRPRVLVVDDNADMRAWLVSLLCESYQVETAGDGEQALALARRRAPSVVVTDVMMPTMDGLELLARLKADPALQRVPVLLLTARAEGDERVAGLDLGADDYLAKPFAPRELLARVRAAVRLHGAWSALHDEHRALLSAHAELRATHDQLVQAAKIAAIGTLVAGLGHELNNPLSVILLNAQALLGRPGLDPEAQRPLAAIERHARRCGQLVSALLDLSRRKQPTPEPVALPALFGRLELLLGTRARRLDARVAFTLEVDDGPALSASMQELETAILNLVGNALDVTPTGGEVTLAARRRDRDGRGGVELAVRDHGPGIPTEVLPHIFEPFFTTKAAGEGTGLGLSIARKIASDLDGTIDVETGPSGTTVRIWLPASPTRELPPPAPPAPGLPPPGPPPAPPPAQGAHP